MRGLMLDGGHSVSGLAFDFALQIGILVVLVFAASRVYANIAR